MGATASAVRLEKQGGLGPWCGMDTVSIREFRSTDRDWLVAQHGEIYAQAEGFDDSFGVLVGQIIDAFLAEADPQAERGWIAQQGETRLGSIFCVRLDAQTAKLRLFLLVPEARGTGLAQRMLDTCMGFARQQGYTDMQLWTHESHRAAGKLYARNGWVLDSSTPVVSFGQPLIEQAWKITL